MNIATVTAAVLTAVASMLNLAAATLCYDRCHRTRTLRYGAAGVILAVTTGILLGTMI